MSIEQKTLSMVKMDETAEQFSASRRALLNGTAAIAVMGAGVSAKRAGAATAQAHEFGAAAAAAIRKGEMTAESYAVTLLERARKNCQSLGRDSHGLYIRASGGCRNVG